MATRFIKMDQYIKNHDVLPNESWTDEQIGDLILHDRDKYVCGSGYYTLFTYLLWVLNKLKNIEKNKEVTTTEEQKHKKKIKL